MCGCGRTLNDCTCAPDFLPPVTYFPYPGTPPRVPYIPPSHCGCNGGNGDNGDSTGGLGSIPSAPGSTPTRSFSYCRLLTPPGRNPVTGTRYPGTQACFSIGPAPVADPF